MKNIAVIGSGTMGNGIAHTFAQFGYSVKLIDINQDFLNKGIETITKNLDRQVKKGTLSEEQKSDTLKNIVTSVNIADASGSDLVIEAATENIGIKKNIFSELDKLCKQETILASNTSSISITEIAAFTKRPDKVIGMHFMNPVPLMKLVEIIRGLATSQDTYDAIKTLTEKIEKTPVEVQDYPGFVANRILLPMLNEAMYCVMEGVAEPDAIDNVMKLGMNHPMGPLTLADFIGLDVCLS
ncbi:MAG TPA: 3-hydroxyacyl-CoA dehydrogenase NAD-binding domain-containing protein, partial [Ignavibacteria bacterium]|nr:3-hydroxyacyl-CoA dehydrogenase NAD-binding domain-containing protein [Ignavibacteria bacterium]